tara:strand:- start:62 stop:751 length:690 start_codon:yes stop_codon:yes gene_type:complete
MKTLIPILIGLLVVGCLSPSSTVVEIPARSAKAKADLIDLGIYYTQALTKPLHTERPNNDLRSMPQGVHVLAETAFDIRGLIQLANTSLREQFPERVDRIKVNRSCQKLHLLHGTGWNAPEGTAIARLILHYENGESRQLSINYGQHVLDWWKYPNDKKEATDSVVAWLGSNGAAEAWGSQEGFTEPILIQLFKTTWTNPLPNAAIRSIDYVSTLTEAAPFILALTLEP